MRIVDLHCYPNTEPWIKSQGPYVEALAKYWNRPWTAKTEEAKKAIKEFGLLGFHFHPIMGHFSVDERRFYPLWETINELGVPVMIDVGTTGMGAGMPGGLGAV